MAHSVSGFEVKYTSRTSWKAEVRSHGGLVAIAPVTWTKGRVQIGAEVFQEVWYQDADEMASMRLSREPFIVAVAIAKNYRKHPHEFQDFQAIFEVVSTGAQLTDKSIETRVLRRLNSKDYPHAPRP
jgi:hypothetical protein